MPDLATINSDRSISHVFHRLDKVRWERERVDVSLLETESDVLGHTAELFDGLLASEPDPECLVAIRLSLSGATRLNGRLQTDPERLVAEVRGLATERGGDRLWIEKVELQTKPLRAATIPDGPFEELVEVLRPTSRRSRFHERRCRGAGRAETQAATRADPRPRQPSARRLRMVANPPGTGPASAPGSIAEISERRCEEPRCEMMSM